jgi:hypothetical protein
MGLALRRGRALPAHNRPGNARRHAPS